MNRTMQLFALGRTLITPGALEAIATAHPGQEMKATSALLWRHAEGDWGEVCKEDAKANDDALETGARLLSAYRLPTGVKVWIITEADRSVTTTLLPDEY